MPPMPTPREPAIRLTAKMELIQDRLGRPLDQWLREAYWHRRRTFVEISADLRRLTSVRVGLRTLSTWFQEFDIPTSRRRPEEREAV